MNESEEKNKIKVLTAASKLDITGISTVIMNYCSHMDPSRFEIIIAAGEPISDIYREKCKCLGIKLYELPDRWKASGSYYKKLNGIIKETRPDILHVHGNSATMSIELFLAWLHGIKVRIPHAHNTTCTGMRLHKMLFPVFSRLYTQAFACGNKAGEWLYKGKPFYIIPNGFDTERFKFNQRSRDKIRSKLNLAEAFIIGHIGRFNPQKNQPFLISIFERYASEHEDAVLLLTGTGPDFEKTKNIVDKSPYKDKIILYGETDAPEDLYSAMDVFVLPSRYEGLPVVLVEAECSGLYCIISDTVTDEMNIGDHITSLSLDDDLKKWCEAIESVPVTDRAAFYEDNTAAIHKYDIAANAVRLEELYTDFVEGKGRQRDA